MKTSADWRALVQGPEFHDGALHDVVHGLDMRTFQFTVERADAFRLRSEGKEPALYRFHFSRVPLFDLRLRPFDDADRSTRRDPLASERNLLGWISAEVLLPAEVLEYGPPARGYEGMRINLHPDAQLVVVFHSLDIEFLGSAGSPWYQNPEGAL